MDSIFFRFQSTHPYGCDPLPCGIDTRPISFNPRTHTGATSQLSSSIQAQVVSIHAPIRVRPLQPDPRKQTPGFNPRTHTGATSARLLSPRLQTCFNPRTHTGATWRRDSMPCVPVVSIHAPIRVRQELELQYNYLQEFQSTHPYGCDGDFTGASGKLDCFNPRTHTGATSGQRWTKPTSCFNPRTHTGATGKLYKLHPGTKVSIHAPIRVRRCRQGWTSASSRVSIHAPIRVRRHLPGLLLAVRSFNPRTHTGATVDAEVTGPLYPVSIHAPIRVRPPLFSPHLPCCCFNPRTHTGATMPRKFSM